MIHSEIDIDRFEADESSVDLAFFRARDMPGDDMIICGVTGTQNVLVSVDCIAKVYGREVEEFLPFASDVHTLTLHDGRKVKSMWLLEINEAFEQLFGRSFHPVDIRTLKSFRLVDPMSMN